MSNSTRRRHAAGQGSSDISFDEDSSKKTSMNRGRSVAVAVCIGITLAGILASHYLATKSGSSVNQGKDYEVKIPATEADSQRILLPVASPGKNRKQSWAITKTNSARTFSLLHRAMINRFNFSLSHALDAEVLAVPSGSVGDEKEVLLSEGRPVTASVLGNCGPPEVLTSERVLRPCVHTTLSTED